MSSFFSQLCISETSARLHITAVCILIAVCAPLSESTTIQKSHDIVDGHLGSFQLEAFVTVQLGTLCWVSVDPIPCFCGNHLGGGLLGIGYAHVSL